MKDQVFQLNQPAPTLPGIRESVNSEIVDLTYPGGGQKRQMPKLEPVIISKQATDPEKRFKTPATERVVDPSISLHTREISSLQPEEKGEIKIHDSIVSSVDIGVGRSGEFALVNKHVISAET